MSYAIVGAGNIGSALARQFARRGIDVSITNKRGPQSLSPLVKELGKYVTAATFADALKADVVFLAIPFPAVPDLATAGIDWNEKVVIDVTNAFGVPSETLAGRTSSEVVASLLPDAAVVKAFNHLPARVLALDPAQNGGKRVVFVSSNDEQASKTVEHLAQQLGFAPVALGRIDEGGRALNIVPGGLLLHNLVEYDYD